jgi:hypothetical protein
VVNVVFFYDVVASAADEFIYLVEPLFSSIPGVWNVLLLPRF